jgi:hypothetical protein
VATDRESTGSRSASTRATEDSDRSEIGGTTAEAVVEMFAGYCRALAEGIGPSGTSLPLFSWNLTVACPPPASA